VLRSFVGRLEPITGYRSSNDDRVTLVVSNRSSVNRNRMTFDLRSLRSDFSRDLIERR
jgi:hypothetical protein